MKNTIRVDHAKKLLVMDRTFAKNAENVRSEEYAILQNVRADYPTYAVERRRIKRNPNKETYRGLTYAYMERYITTHDNADANFAEYRELRILAECHSVRYPRIKEWFLLTYPAVEKYGMPDIETLGAPETEHIPATETPEVVQLSTADESDAA